MTKLWAIYSAGCGAHGEYLAAEDIHDADTTVRQLTAAIVCGDLPARIGPVRIMPWPFSAQEHALALADGDPRVRPEEA